jgi:predicted Zn-dependent protease with MMP-like domain
MNIDELIKDLLPLYETTLPFSKKVVSYHPFKVKDAKNISIILKEENKRLSLNAMVSLLKANTKDLDVDDLCLADAEYLYLQMRGKSVGEEIVLKVNEKPFKLNINDIKYRNQLTEKIIKIKEGISVTLKTPKIKDLLLFENDDKILDTKKYIKNLVVKNEVFDVYKFVPEELKQLIENVPYSFLKDIEKFSKEQPELYFLFKDDEGEREVSGTLSFFTLLQTLLI